MKKCLYILLAIQVLTISPSNHPILRQLVETGAFLHHFVHHLTCQADEIGVLEFIQLHYSNHEHHQSDHGEHDKLPFRCHHQDCQHIVQLLPFLPIQNVFPLVFPELDPMTSQLISASQQWVASLCPGDIWQPPRV